MIEPKTRADMDMRYFSEIDTEPYRLQWRENPLRLYRDPEEELDEVTGKMIFNIKAYWLQDEIELLLEETEMDITIDTDKFINRDQVLEIVFYSSCPWKHDFEEWFKEIANGAVCDNWLTMPHDQYIRGRYDARTPLKIIRILRGYEQQEVARETSISPSLLSKLESGQTLPTKSNAEKLAEFYDESIGFLFDMDEDEVDSLNSSTSHLRDLRRSRNMTLRDVADGTGLSESYLSKLERNTMIVTENAEEKLTRFFGVESTMSDCVVLSAQEKGNHDPYLEDANEKLESKGIAFDTKELIEETQTMTLKQFRKQQGLTLKQLAASLEISVSYLSMMEKGTRALSEDVVGNIMDFYDVEISEG